MDAKPIWLEEVPASRVLGGSGHGSDASSLGRVARFWAFRHGPVTAPRVATGMPISRAERGGLGQAIRNQDFRLGILHLAPILGRPNVAFQSGNSLYANNDLVRRPCILMGESSN